MAGYELFKVSLRTGDAEVDTLISRIWKAKHGVYILREIEEVLALKNFPEVFSRGNAGAWTPLNRAYLARKVRQGYSPLIWKRTGQTFKAMTTRVSINVAGGRNAGREILVTENAGGLVRATVRMKPQISRGRFKRNNEARPWMVILPEMEPEILDRVGEIFKKSFASSGWKLR